MYVSGSDYFGTISSTAAMICYKGREGEARQILLITSSYCVGGCCILYGQSGAYLPADIFQFFSATALQAKG